MFPNPPLPHEAIRERAWDELWRLLLNERPDQPTPDDEPQPDEGGGADERTAA